MAQVNPGFQTFPEISAFLGSLTFAGFLLLLDKQDLFSNVIILNFSVNLYTFLIFSLAIETLLFVLCTVFFGFACMNPKHEDVNLAVNSLMLFFLSVILLLVSLVIVFVSINGWLGLMSILTIVGAFIFLGGYSVNAVMNGTEQANGEKTE